MSTSRRIVPSEESRTGSLCPRETLGSVDPGGSEPSWYRVRTTDSRETRFRPLLAAIRRPPGHVPSAPRARGEVGCVMRRINGLPLRTVAMNPKPLSVLRLIAPVVNAPVALRHEGLYPYRHFDLFRTSSEASIKALWLPRTSYVLRRLRVRAFSDCLQPCGQSSFRWSLAPICRPVTRLTAPGNHRADTSWLAGIDRVAHVFASRRR